MSYVVTPPPAASVPVLGHAGRFPVHRIYCVGRNYEEHAKEMGFTGREPPFFFLKPADAALPVNAGETGTIGPMGALCSKLLPMSQGRPCFFISFCRSRRVMSRPTA